VRPLPVYASMPALRLIRTTASAAQLAGHYDVPAAYLAKQPPVARHGDNRRHRCIAAARSSRTNPGTAGPGAVSTDRSAVTMDLSTAP
jgi:hypothetical protein